ncbi:MAG: ureidoglycolate lyase [Hyphomicrobiales bacterium]|nr:ureidoglycolate lyase [Hyphomicrobiales bacterium]
MSGISRRTLLAAGVGAAAYAALSDLGARAAQATVAETGHEFTTRGPAPKTSVATHTVRKLKAETITAENFAPFGRVLTAAGRPRLPVNTYGDKFDLYREGFESDQPIEWFIVKGVYRGLGALFVERHMQLTQTFIPVGGRPFFTIVARPGAREENGFPALDELRAFFVPGDVAFQLHRGAWHENPLPTEKGASLLVTSHANLTLAHQQNPDPKLKELPLDLERRWYKAGGYDITIDA